GEQVRAAAAVRADRATRAAWAARLRTPVPSGIRGAHASWIEVGLAGLPQRARASVASGSGDAVDTWLARWATAAIPPMPAGDRAGPAGGGRGEDRGGPGGGARAPPAPPARGGGRRGARWPPPPGRGEPPGRPPEPPPCAPPGGGRGARRRPPPAGGGRIRP